VSEDNESVEANLVPSIMASAVDQGGRLLSVECLMDEDLPKGPVALRLEFERLSFYLLADANDDTISVASSLPDELHSLRVSKVDDQAGPWKGAVGSALSWAWLLTNQQGYADGVQLEFRGGERAELSCIQVIAVASTL
jgi:hypothetical protein